MELRVGTFNILNTSCRYSERKPLITDTLRSLDCHIIGVQEVNFSKNIEDISLPGYTLLTGAITAPIVHAEDPEFRIDGNAILVKDGLRVTQTQTIVFQSKRRCAILAWIEANGAEFIFVCTHLDARSDDTRLSEVQELLAFLAAYAPIPTIITGDFNCNPKTSPYVLLSQTYKSAYVEVHGEEPVLTFPTGLMGEHVCLYYRLTVDYIWLKGPWTASQAEITCSYADENLFASDHYALWANVQLARLE
jgi:nocturnin